MSNFENQISQAEDKTEIRISLSDLYLRKTDEKMNIQKMKNSIKKVF